MIGRNKDSAGQPQRQSRTKTTLTATSETAWREAMLVQATRQTELLEDIKSLLQQSKGDTP